MSEQVQDGVEFSGVQMWQHMQELVNQIPLARLEPDGPVDQITGTGQRIQVTSLVEGYDTTGIELKTNWLGWGTVSNCFLSLHVRMQASAEEQAGISWEAGKGSQGDDTLHCEVVCKSGDDLYAKLHSFGHRFITDALALRQEGEAFTS